ncbi:MAG: hypothetical protein R3360_09765, partial [Alphaproteobacteria bacterium]|nr:hypothetical protein [Alphaproteobacteria bacterium]
MLKRALPLAALAFVLSFSISPLRAEETELPVDAARLLEISAQRDAATDDETATAFLSTLSLLLESYPERAA